MTALEQQGRCAKQAARSLATAGSAQKCAALEAIAALLHRQKDLWLAANAEDVAAAREAGMGTAMLDRLTLTPERIDGIVDAVRQVAALPDPIGQVTHMETRPNGLVIGRKTVPLGVIAIIFEARPNVTVDAAALCLKSGNVCILRGGKEAIRSNRAVVSLMRQALEQAGLPADCVSLVQDTSHETANELMHLNRYVDVLIPRGGAGLIRAVANQASVPVIRTGEGVCHIFIDRDGDLDMGASILCNAKCSRPSVCNAAECVLIAEDVAAAFLEKALPLLAPYHVELRCDTAALPLVPGGIPAVEADWDAEYDDYILAVHIVKDLAEAVDFISDHGTGHSESIITNNYFTAQHFLDQVDAAAVYVNASTRFTDGGEFGLGAEIGISTQKMHARGPMGLAELTSCKYIIYGEGQIRE
ncbi:MAG: glutamate-5-semialdehyde dehydrogenase [Oscillibacter sp.]